MPAVIPTPILYEELRNDIEDRFKDAVLPAQQTDWSGLNSYGFSSGRGGNLFAAMESV